ncbi:MAG: DegT/DnrJ/EryC1/StrS family aminotransferase [Candidatus Hydrogenedentes bacterium]|jgi:L-glutamine:2-deoxy-scyllo-inosose/3-amino-2,3-dideoxy-scyllo-inosose aminotransferase|nr:DegT/DnrJ/EryC1/StrS family aminotransferase [Candidatus Hydrogenedentota bacterium]
MAKLAICGGTPSVPKNKKWATWPISNEADAKLVAKITSSNRWSYDGPTEWEFAEKFTAYQGAKFGMCCANGTVGIQLALEALGVGAYDEVIVPVMTWQATAAACVDVSAIPILVDIEPDTWNLDLDAVEAAITDKTKAIIVVHLYGCMTDMTRLQKICKKHNLFLIEDCAHQHGSFWKGKGVGSFGDVSSWSFQESKVLSSGEGGFNMCKTRDLFYKLYSLRNCGRPYEADPAVFGLTKPANMSATTLQSGNYRLTEWQAAILLGGLKRLDKQVKQREANAMLLDSLLAEIPGIIPMRRRQEVTQQSYFNYAFRIDPKELKVDNRQFSTALNMEFNVPELFEPPYEPLNNCGLYKPQTKTRHILNPKYWKAIDPTRFVTPVATEAHEQSGVVAHHQILMNTAADMKLFARIVKKIVDNIDELRSVKPAELKKYGALAH